MTAAELPADDWADAEPAAPARPLEFPDVGAFVADYLAPLYRRPLGAGRTWCAEWWRHAEAIVRLRALWLAWEHLRWEPALGMAVWTRDHLDPQMAVLLDGDGPFHGCSSERHNGARLAVLRVLPPPDGFAFPGDHPGGDNGDNVPNVPTGG